MTKEISTEDQQILPPKEDLEEDGHLSKGSVILLNLSWFGLSFMMIVLSVEVIPPQIQAMVGENSKGRWLGGIVGIGAIVTFITGPLIGMKSDRLESEHGKRRPIMVASATILCMSLLGMAFSAPQITITQSVDHPELCKDETEELLANRCHLNVNKTHPLTWYLSKSGSSPNVGSPPKNNMKFTFTNQEEIVGNVWLFAIFYMIMTMCATGFLVSYSALLADKSHPQQRGFTSGVMGFMVLFGQVAGACLGLVIVQMGVMWVYGCVVILLVATIFITVCTTQEPPAKCVHTPLSCAAVIIAFYEPLREVNYRWVFITRFLMQQGLYTVTGFLEFWLGDMAILPYCWSPQRSLAMFLFPVMVTAALMSVLCGILSDKYKRRKPFIITGCMGMFITAVVFSGLRGVHAYTVAMSMSFVFGAGFGSFSAVDFALLLDVLPQEKDTGKDVALYQQATTLGMALATPIGGIIIDVFEGINCQIGLGYIILFIITAIYFLLSGLFVLRITGVK